MNSMTLFIVAMSIAIFGTRPVSASLIVYTDETTFLSGAPIVSTETFDEFPSPTKFFTPQVVIDRVAYRVDQPCVAEGKPNPCWVVGIHLGLAPITPPNDFGATFAQGISEHSIGFDGYVTAFGFWFISGGNARWEILIHEIDRTTVQNIESSQGSLQQYFGFVSDIGIRGFTVRDFQGDSGATNWSYDNVHAV